MATSTTKHWRPIVLILLIIAGSWSWILLANLKPVLGLDLEGGIAVVLCPAQQDSDECGTAEEGSLEQAVNIIRNRVDALGVAEPDISRQGANVLIQIPGIEDQQRALELIGTTAKLRFRPVLENVAPPASPEEAEQQGLPVCGDPDTYPADDPTKEVVFCQEESGRPTGLLRLGLAALEGSDVSRADPQVDQTGLWQVSLRMTGEGAKKFADITGKLACNRGTPPGDQLAIVLDRVIVSAPNMGAEVQCNVGIAGGEAQITGNFTRDDATGLALVLRYGALPVELKPQSTTTVSPTLGRESLRSGLIAAVIGVAIVFLYVLAFYRGLALMIWLGIGLHAAITFAVVILLGQAAGFALSLAGLAGLIVSLGIAADSFIVYFERIKDEVLGGRTARAAVDRAWGSARRTILAADLVTALAAVVLYFLAVGSVRGFALMLGLATALDVFISFWFMHPGVWILANTRALGRSKTLGLRGAERHAMAAEGGPA